MNHRLPPAVAAMRGRSSYATTITLCRAR
jgi:hypothetical protein